MRITGVLAQHQRWIETSFEATEPAGERRIDDVLVWVQWMDLYKQNWLKMLARVQRMDLYEQSWLLVTIGAKRLSLVMSQFLFRRSKTDGGGPGVFPRSALGGSRGSGGGKRFKSTGRDGRGASGHEKSQATAWPFVSG